MILSLVLMALMQQPPSNGGIVHCHSYKSGVNDCTVCDNGPTSCTLVAPLNGLVIDSSSRPEPMDVPAIEVSAPSEIVWQSGPFDIQSCTNGGHIVEGNGLIACEGGKRKTCADKSRVLLTAENGEKHCVLFQP